MHSGPSIPAEHMQRPRRLSAGMCAQVLDLSGAEGSESGLEEGSDISGLSFTPTGRRLYVGLEGGPGQGIAAFDVNMLSRLTFGSAQLC